MWFGHGTPSAWIVQMSYTAAALVVILCLVAAGLASFAVARRLSYAVRRNHHEVGGAVFLQLGVIYAVLLAFVFSQVWNEYNVAAQAISAECADLHGSAMLAQALPQQAGKALNQASARYVSTVVTKEWPLMTARRESAEAISDFQTMIRTAANLPATGPHNNDIHDQIVTLLLDAHAKRETRLFEMTQGIPVILWGVIIVYAAVLASFVVLSGVEYAPSLIVFSILFCGLNLMILVIIKMLDYPFEGALALPPVDFQKTLVTLQILAGKT
jgi:hypothetical protein